jgi:hypothetical protein
MPGLDYNLLRNNILKLLTNERSSALQFAQDFANAYEPFARTAIPSPILTGKSGVLISSIVAGMTAIVAPATIAGIVNGFTLYWQAVPVIGPPPLFTPGVTTAFLGPINLSAALALLFSTMNTTDQASSILTNALYAATHQVQYTLAASPPVVGFLL